MRRAGVCADSRLVYFRIRLIRSAPKSLFGGKVRGRGPWLPCPQNNRARLLEMPRHGRVLTLQDGRCIPYVTGGAFADVFIDDRAGRVYKVLVSEPERGLPRSLSAAALNAIRRDNFVSQVDAYRIAGTDPILLAHIPQFFGTVQAAAVHDAAGRIVSNEYLLDACYVVQRLEGRDEKADHRSEDVYKRQERDRPAASHAT